MKFKYGDEVIVTKGFYKDLVGNVVSYNTLQDSFSCILHCVNGKLATEYPYATILACDLRKIV